jgi:dUTP pyrophosphatase
MKIKQLHTNFQMPSRGTNGAAGYDIAMPEGGVVTAGQAKKVSLGFAAEVPPGYVALLLPRSGVGFKHGVELHNTCGVIDSDYRGEWFASLHIKTGTQFTWHAGEKLLQFILVPVYTPELLLVNELSDTDRGTGGLGSTGK